MKLYFSHFAFLAAFICIYSVGPVFCQGIADTAGCNNFSGYSEADSLFGINNFALYQTIQSDLSPDGRYLATSMLNDNYPSWGNFYDGSVIIDLYTKRIVKHVGSYRPRWSPDGSRILMLDYIYVLDNDSIVSFPSSGSQYSLFNPQWSRDGNYIYYSNPSGGYRSDKYGKNMIYIGFKPAIIPLTDSTLFYIPNYFENSQKRYYILYNMKTAVSDTVLASALDPSSEFDGVRDIFGIAVSRNQRFFTADFRYYGHPGEWAGRGGVGMYDFERNRFKEILQPQAFNSFYYPSWSSDSTLLVSIICHSDSSYTTWEIDTNGVFLRQLTRKDILPNVTKLDYLAAISTYSISSFFPHPGNALGMLEYDVEKAGAYSLSIISLNGKEVRGILKDKWHEPGRHQASVRTDDLPPGMYLIRLSNSRNQPVYHKLIIDK